MGEAGGRIGERPAGLEGDQGIRAVTFPVGAASQAHPAQDWDSVSGWLTKSAMG
jgi:hypothetical protein